MKFVYDTKKGTYYCFTIEDSKDKLIKEDYIGYWFGSIKNKTYLNQEETEKLNNFRKQNQ